MDRSFSSDGFSSEGAGTRGIALLMVITVLVTLVLIAVPFAISMRQGRERTTSELAKGRAEFEAEVLIEAMKHYLGNTHPMLERERWARGERTIDSDPNVDNLAEITIGSDFRKVLGQSWGEALTSENVGGGNTRLAAHMQALEASGLGLLNDDRGSIWTGIADDANGRVNANGVSPYLLGNLLGSALLAEDIDPSATDIAVEHVVASRMPRLASFPADGGYLRIGGEVVQYGSFDGNTFRQCVRGAIPETPLKDNGTGASHEIGTPVIDYVAYKVATHLIAARPKVLTWFRNLEDLRSIASWGAGPGFDADRLDRIRDFLTVWSRRETASGWLAPLVVVNQLPVAADPTAPDEIEVRDQKNPTGSTAYMNPGTIVRIHDGKHTVYQAVAAVGDLNGGRKDKCVTLAGRVDAGYEEKGLTFEGGKAMLSTWAPFPIDINTAPREVLYACLANLHVEGTDSAENIVTPELAVTLADMIVDERARALALSSENNERETGPFRHIADYGRWLEMLEEQGTISTLQRAALYRNAVNPHDHQLTFGTAPWCYRTLDVYHLEARVAVNSRGGEQLATAVRKEVVEIGSDDKTTWQLDSQAEFEERLSMGHGAKWMATHPFGVNFRSEATAHIQPAPRARKALQFHVYPNTKRSGEDAEMEQRGEVRLEPSRIKFDLPGAVVRNHFDSTLFTEGWRTDFSGVFTRKTRGAFLPEDEDYSRAFSMSFWWNAYSDANWTAFDCGMEKFQNRYAVFVTEGEEGPELVFRVCAATLEKRGAEIYVPLERIDFVPGTWYHIHVSANGEDPSMMEMLIDGVSVGRRRGITWLSGGLTEDQTEIQVEDTLGFPDVGAIMIGSEIIEYETRNGDGFAVCLRGARGTAAQAWPIGTPVREVGYSLQLTVDAMVGGAKIPDVLGYWAAARLEVEPGGADVDIRKFTDTQDPPVIWEFHGIAPETQTFEANLLPLWTDCSEEEMGEAFGVKGIALMGCQRISVNGANADRDDDNNQWLHGWEVVYYERDSITTPTVRIVERNIQSWDRPEWPGTEDETPNFLAFFVGQQGAPPDTIVPAFLVPISILASGSTSAGDDYLDPSRPEDEDVLQRYFRPSGSGQKPYVPARVAIGLPSDQGADPEDVEIIAYDRIERTLAGSDILFVRDRFIAYLTIPFFGKPDKNGDPVTDDDGFDDETEEVVEEEAVPDARVEDVPPPGKVEIPEEDPEVDSSGGGDDERAEEEIEYPEEVIGVLDDPGAPRDFGDVSGTYNEPAWQQLADNVRRYFRGLYPARDGLVHDWRHDPTSGASRKDLVLPCFYVYEGADMAGYQLSVGEGGRRVGRNDRVTFVTGKADDVRRESARIRWGSSVSGWVALDDFLIHRYPADAEGGSTYRPDLRGATRMLKFPSGELPDELPVEMEFGRSTVSNSEVVTAMLDELNIWNHRQGTFLFLEPPEVTSGQSDELYGIQPSDDEIRLVARHFGEISTFEGFDETCGLLDLDGELIVYREARWEQGHRDDLDFQVLVLERCERGVLGTIPRFHGEAACGRLVPHIPVSYLDGRVSRDSSSLPLARTRGWPREGLLRIIDGAQMELVHYTRLGEDSVLLPESMDVDTKSRGRGLLRGRFGTDAIGHDADAIVFFQPFRYWDRYMPRRTEDDQAFAGVHDHPQSSYLEFGKRLRSGYWHRLGWEEGPSDDVGGSAGHDARRSDGETTGFLDVIVLARFSPNVPWDSEHIVDLRSEASTAYGRSAGNDRPLDALYVFDDPDAENRLEVEADTAEVRVYFVYRPGCYQPQDLLTETAGAEDLVFVNDWKRTPSLMGLTLEYTSRTTTLNRSLR